MLPVSLVAPLVAGGTAERYCGDRPTTGCKLAWNISHNVGVTRFYHDWLDNNAIVGGTVKIIATIAIAMVLRRLAHKMITKVTLRMGAGTMPAKIRERTRTIFDGSPALVSERRRQRAETMGSLLRNIASVLIYGTAALTVLGYLGLNLAPFLATASIIGVAVGFGAQNLVKDFLAGMFMLLEDQYGIGDSIDVGTAAGTVEAVTLRTTRLRDLNGVVWYIPNGEIKRVGNQSQNWARAVLDVPVDYGEDVDKVRMLLKDTAVALVAEPPWDDIVLEEPSVWGVQALSGEAVVVRLVLKTAPGRQSEIARVLRERVKKAFDEAGIGVATFKQDTSAA